MSKGFSLIEIMIVIAVIALVVLVAAPLTGNWVSDAKRIEAEAQLTQAVGRAKAAALRNHMAATGESPVTAICLSDSNLLTVLEGTAGAAPSCASAGGTKLWQAQLHKGISVKVDSNDFSCVCFNNKGLLTTSGSCSACATTSNLSLDGEDPLALH